MTIRSKVWLLLGAVLLLGTAGPDDDPASAWSRLRPVRGEAEHASVEWDQTLLDIAHDHGLGFENVARLNPDLDPWIPAPGSIVRLPTRFVLPDAKTEGIVVNLPEMRLYDYTESGTGSARSARIRPGTSRARFDARSRICRNRCRRDRTIHSAIAG
jgi:L,D-transpeptidase ErfK/SrfK